MYADAETAISETSADSVYLATPVGLHIEHACAALEAEKNVLIEKPLALTADDCDKVIA
ncbi:MAG: Gfo/Idh/MocA family oxidoreductase, partial [Planctomycetota bacterium]